MSRAPLLASFEKFKKKRKNAGRYVRDADRRVQCVKQIGKNCDRQQADEDGQLSLMHLQYR